MWADGALQVGRAVEGHSLGSLHSGPMVGPVLYQMTSHPHLPPLILGENSRTASSSRSVPPAPSTEKA